MQTQLAEAYPLHDCPPANHSEDSKAMRSYKLHDKPSEPTVTAPTLVKFFDEYIDACSARGVNRRAVESYAYQSRPFLHWWLAWGRDHDWKFTPTAGKEFARWLRDDYRNRFGQQPRPNTRKATIHRVRAYLHWLYTDHRVNVDMALWLPLPSKPKPHVRVLTYDEIVTIMRATHGRSRVRDLTLLCFMLETGVRRFEAANAMWENVHYEDGFRGWCYLETVKGYMDQDKTRTVVFGENAGRLLKLYSIVCNQDDPHIFGLSASGMANLLARLSDRSGVEFTAHDLRRTFATHFVKNFPKSDHLAKRLVEYQMGHAPHGMLDEHYVTVDHRDVYQHYLSPLGQVDMLRLG